MRYVSVAELKTNAEEIVAAVHAGEKIEIMREGMSVARIIGTKRPELADTRTPEQRQQQREAVEGLADIGRAVFARHGPTSAIEIREWIEDGRA